MRRQSNIEIYVKGCPTNKLIAWIAQQIGTLDRASAFDGQIVYDSRIGPVTIAVEDSSFTSAHFQSADTPWVTDVDCARQAARELRCIVRCDPGEHFPDVHSLSDTFLQITADGQESLLTIDEIEGRRE